MQPYIVARSLDGFKAANGIWVNPDYGFSDCPSPHIVCIPDFFVNPGESVAGMYEPEARWLKRSHEDGAMLASACSGAVLLGEAGLLVDCEATIHWGYVATLSNNYPGVRVRVDRSLVLSGEAQRIVMAGGGSSWQDLALYLIARFVGLKEAMEVAKVYMLQWHDLGQQPFASLMSLRQSTDAVINTCQAWLAMNYKTRAPVAAMVALSGLPERSFVRRFIKAAGMTPLNYVHAVRLEEAKQILETTDLPIEALANEMGYEDASFFGRLFRRETGITPAHYRLRLFPEREPDLAQLMEPSHAPGIIH
ncbi:helix-turn-helix domain-containing protein (plasmid) [Rhizobium ruizarguesonis]|uniref:GlxA family transcriptional regulator n=1 Tax=Rhizobium ruizarguesonis TaxID=2081791 RepID=UPI001031ED3E|nr:helix-turn-helix domain-containing protein [Rhizobium ruizarguesonis]QND22987.1 helix-turn-helix domain-containing protein [Rhizobium leguminosarum bv. viciae]TAU18770.1 helix-turn-helix domain-containing protein [Rhizobium ruizarguesonis]